MGYFTYRLFHDVPIERLAQKVKANLALYEPASVGRLIQVNAFQGDGCSALLLDYLKREESILQAIGYQFGCVWMDVRYQDGDSWSLSVFEGAEHRVSHNVNPWADDLRADYNQAHIDHRIDRICELWPRQGDVLRPYLLPWRIPTKRLGRTSFIPRQGKAYETDGHAYGDADQIHDFISRFGITSASYTIVIGGKA